MKVRVVVELTRQHPRAKAPERVAEDMARAAAGLGWRVADVRLANITNRSRPHLVKGGASEEGAPLEKGAPSSRDRGS